MFRKEPDRDLEKHEYSLIRSKKYYSQQVSCEYKKVTFQCFCPFFESEISEIIHLSLTHFLSSSSDVTIIGAKSDLFWWGLTLTQSKKYILFKNMKLLVKLQKAGRKILDRDSDKEQRPSLTRWNSFMGPVFEKLPFVEIFSDHFLRT